jgi:hypothetical protein
MQRRFFLAAASLAAALGGCAGVPPSYTISAQRLEQALARRFPRRYPVAGLLELELQTPRLTLLPERNQINAVLALETSGPLLRQRRYGGVLDVDFGLRYEPSDRSLRAHNLHVNALRVDGLPPAWADTLTRYAQPLADQALREVVLHQWQPQELSAVTGLGWEPAEITVTPQGLAVGFRKLP